MTIFKFKVPVPFTLIHGEEDQISERLRAVYHDTLSCGDYAAKTYGISDFQLSKDGEDLNIWLTREELQILKEKDWIESLREE
jgi:hypothetical protein